MNERQVFSIALQKATAVERSDYLDRACGSDPKMRGTPAAPEPMASRLRFYEDEELGSLAHQAGFTSVSVVHRDLEAYAREAGVPEEYLPLFAGGTPFLLTRKELPSNPRRAKRLLGVRAPARRSEARQENGRAQPHLYRYRR